MILGLTGYAQSGKDTVANILVEQFGFTRVAYADKLKELLMRQNPTVVVDGEPKELATLVADSDWDTAKQNVEVRALLQRTGQGARETLGDSIWLNGLSLKLVELGYQPGSMNVVISDVRYPNEIAGTTDMWRVSREGVGPVNDHDTERLLETIPVSHVIENNGTLDDLYQKVSDALSVGSQRN